MMTPRSERETLKVLHEGAASREIVKRGGKRSKAALPAASHRKNSNANWQIEAGKV
jgi:hypothetical protein